MNKPTRKDQPMNTDLLTTKNKQTEEWAEQMLIYLDKQAAGLAQYIAENDLAAADDMANEIINVIRNLKNTGGIEIYSRRPYHTYKLRLDKPRTAYWIELENTYNANLTKTNNNRPERINQ